MKRRNAHDKARFNQRNDAAALVQFMAGMQPDVMVTLGTNRAMSADRLRELVNDTIFEFEQIVMRTRRPYKKSAKDRLCAFILPEKLDVNAHVHLLIFFPRKSAWKRSQARLCLVKGRHKDHFIGYGRNYGRHDSYNDQKDLAPLLEHLWRKRGKGFHYHAQFIDGSPEVVAQYVSKEQNRVGAEPFHMTCFDWSSRQPDMNAVIDAMRC
ncbi:MAG: hypothetical protein ACXIVO_09070 [Glycocaulis sp.]